MADRPLARPVSETIAAWIRVQTSGPARRPQRRSRRLGCERRSTTSPRGTIGTTPTVSRRRESRCVTREAWPAGRSIGGPDCRRYWPTMFTEMPQFYRSSSYYTFSPGSFTAITGASGGTNQLRSARMSAAGRVPRPVCGHGATGARSLDGMGFSLETRKPLVDAHIPGGLP